MNSHRVIIVSFLEPHHEQFVFTKWLNHITIVPYFQTNNLQNLIMDMRSVCRNKHDIPYIVGTVDYFGPEKKVEVSKIILNNKLLALHESLLNIALQNDPHMEVKYCGENYKPHITHNNVPYPEENGEGILQTLYLVENLSPAKEMKNLQEKKVLAVIQLI